MVQVLFFRGHAETPEKALGNALKECAPLLLEDPSLVVQLEGMAQTGKNWDADIRVLALADNAGEGRGKKRKNAGPSLELSVKDPERAKFLNPDKGALSGMGHAPPSAAYRFSHSALAGEIPDIPIQDIRMSDYELSRAPEPELRRMLEELEMKRRELYEQPRPEPE